jgi:hypothetical protein
MLHLIGSIGLNLGITASFGQFCSLTFHRPIFADGLVQILVLVVVWMTAEIQRLRKENARLLMEREILKKAAAFFAKEQT